MIRRPRQAALVWVVTLAAAGLTVAAPRATATALDVAAISAILVIGLPHGALDLAELRADPGISSGRPAILIVYLALLVLTVLVWRADPRVALVGFLLLSIWHFAGEWRDDLPGPAAWPAAALLVALPAAVHHGAVAGLFASLSGNDRLGAALAALAGFAALPLAAGLIATLAARGVGGPEAMILIALGVAGLALAPLHAFAIFFALVHAPRHLVKSAVDLDRPLARIVRDAVPLTLVAIVAFLILLLSLDRPYLPATLSFLLLAVLAVPHMFSRSVLRSVNRFYPMVRTRPALSMRQD